jgi:CRISPR-associated protein Cmr2
MAFIYADGNGMGEILRTMGQRYTGESDTQSAYRAFSEIVDRACREAAVEAVLKHVPQNKVETKTGPAWMIPAEFIMAGGDDLMLVVPAQCALEVAADFLDLYQEKTRLFQKEYEADGRLSRGFALCGLTSSAGIVVAHAHYPVRHLMELAAELMKIAKLDAAQQPEGETVGTMDFMVISDAASGHVKTRRRNEYRTENACSLTARPYTTDHTRWMVNTIRRLKQADTPRSKMKKLYASLFQSPLQAQYDGLQIRERLIAMGKLDQGSPLADLFDRLTAFPFEPKDGNDKSWQTPLSEIMEFYDYIQLKNKDGRHASMDVSTEI